MNIANIPPIRQRLCALKPVQTQGIQNIKVRRTLGRKLDIKRRLEEKRLKRVKNEQGTRRNWIDKSIERDKKCEQKCSFSEIKLQIVKERKYTYIKFLSDQNMNDNQLSIICKYIKSFSLLESLDLDFSL